MENRRSFLNKLIATATVPFVIKYADGSQEKIPVRYAKRKGLHITMLTSDGEWINGPAIGTLKWLDKLPKDSGFYPECGYLIATKPLLLTKGTVIFDKRITHFRLLDDEGIVISERSMEVNLGGSLNEYTLTVTWALACGVLKDNSIGKYSASLLRKKIDPYLTKGHGNDR